MGLKLRHRLLRFAFRRLRAFPVIGWGGGELWRTLCSRGDIDCVQSPHATDIVVLAGEIPRQWYQRLRALIETVALPRAVVWLCPAERLRTPQGLAVGRLLWPEEIADFDLQELLPLLAHREYGNESFCAGGWVSPDTPFGLGRGLAQPAVDSDGLELDDVPLLLGPHLPFLPPGLQLALRMQGDRIRECESVHNAFPIGRLERLRPHRRDPRAAASLRALEGQPVTIAELERARIYSHLCWMADFLVLAGLPGWGSRLRRRRHDIDAETLRRLLRPIERALRPLLEGAGHVGMAEAKRAGVVGPVARASGLAVDSRASDLGYQRIGFEPIEERGGDLWARWRVRARECLQSLTLIQRAGTLASLAAESPRGQLLRRNGLFIAPTTTSLRLLPDKLAGMDWQTAILFIASLDLCMEEAALQ